MKDKGKQNRWKKSEWVEDLKGRNMTNNGNVVFHVSVSVFKNPHPYESQEEEMSRGSNMGEKIFYIAKF